MNVTESVDFQDFTTTQGPFTLRGGIYTFTVVNGAWNSASLSLNALGPDGTTYAETSNVAGTGASLSANGMVCGIYLPPGQYEMVASSTPTDGWYAVVASVPT
jgi:hypothetical protein